MLKKFKDLSEKEILALAIASEEEDGRIYGEFADALRETYPATAQNVRRDARGRGRSTATVCLAMFRQRFGDHIPLIRRENVKGFLQRRNHLAGEAAGRKRGPETSRNHGDGSGRFYARAVSPHHRCSHARIIEQTRRRRAKTLCHRRRSRRKTFDRTRASGGRGITPQISFAANRPARAWRD